MLKITLKNGDVVTWRKEEYSDFKYDGKCFTIFCDDNMVGLYNIDTLICITIKE